MYIFVFRSKKKGQKKKNENKTDKELPVYDNSGYVGEKPSLEPNETVEEAMSQTQF